MIIPNLSDPKPRRKTIRTTLGRTKRGSFCRWMGGWRNCAQGGLTWMPKNAIRAALRSSRTSGIASSKLSRGHGERRRVYTRFGSLARARRRPLRRNSLCGNLVSPSLCKTIRPIRPTSLSGSVFGFDWSSVFQWKGDVASNGKGEVCTIRPRKTTWKCVLHTSHVHHADTCDPCCVHVRVRGACATWERSHASAESRETRQRPVRDA